MNYKFNPPKIAIIGGVGIYDPKIFKKEREIKIKTPFGFPSASIKIGDFEGKKVLFLARHGKGIAIPPHKINHKANISALKKLGVKYIFAFNSVGSFKKELRPGDFLVPLDFVDFDPPTFYERNPEFITPQISQKLRRVLIKICKKLRLKFWPKGTYFNTKGPRFETKAEIKMIKNFADVVGMTMAKEVTLSNELGLEYASLCSVDNYAHGIVKKSLTQKGIEENQKRNKQFIEKIIKEILKAKI